MHIRFDTYQQRTAEATSFAQETVLSLQFFYVMIANSREAKGELIMWEIIEEAVLDCAKILPFLFLSYLAVEYTEHRMSRKTKAMIYRAGKAGPLLGGLIGIIPQCGFSAAAAGLFAGGILTPGTLIAVFLSTSDEMLPIMISEGLPVSEILRILLAKAATGFVAGMIIDFVAERMGWRRPIPEHPEMCEHEHCHCSEHGIFRSALSHTIQITVFLVVISIVLGFVMEELQANGVSSIFGSIPGLEAGLAALVGMIPNCAASVLITQLYISGLLDSGAMFAGLLCGAGTGLLVLFRENPDKKENLRLLAVLYVSGVAAGLLLGAIHIL